jgi:hypothetical protein
MPNPTPLKSDRLNFPVIFRPAFAQAGELARQDFAIERITAAVIF